MRNIFGSEVSKRKGKVKSKKVKVKKAGLRLLELRASVFGFIFSFYLLTFAF